MNPSKPSPFLSIILPVHNEEKRLPGTLQQVARFISAQSFNSEVLIVENGSNDRSYEIARQFSMEHPSFFAFHEDQRGKGLAVRNGMLNARGDYRIFCDVDFSMPVDEIVRFLPPQQVNADIVIGSREAIGAVRYHEPAYRHFIGRIFNSMVRLTTLPGLQDSQCGFKLFTAQCAEAVFQKQTLNGMSFDVEVLFIARRLGYSIIEIPIPWYFNQDSRVRLVDDSMRMAIDLFIIRRNAARGLYGPPKM
ncbi:MAG TPA: dolichyl-phosphate beta-glucosyltransferase [Leptolinea sp.]